MLEKGDKKMEFTGGRLVKKDKKNNEVHVLEVMSVLRELVNFNGKRRQSGRLNRMKKMKKDP